MYFCDCLYDDVKVMKGERNEASTHSTTLYLVFPGGGGVQPTPNL